MEKKVTLEKAISIVCQYCVKCCCEDDCPVNATQEHYEGTEMYTKELDVDKF